MQSYLEVQQQPPLKDERTLERLPCWLYVRGGGGEGGGAELPAEHLGSLSAFVLNY